MYLKKLEIHGFKSLADKIELEFNPGVSAVVGPNGSGKSNIADAVRWVLGEQSVKSLRGARMEDVIFAGSDKRKPVGMAEVSMTLDNSLSVFPLDFSEITVTRRVYRSGESEYLINKSACRLKDIHELFMDTGIGREGYSIIGQGKIEEILSARSEDRRVIIEEAAGIVKYKNRKQQAVKKLNDTEQNLVRISDIIRELESQVGPLEEQSLKARQYLEYRDELVDLEVNLLVNQIDDNKARLAEIHEREEKLSRQAIETETTLRNMESEIESAKLLVNKLDEEITELQRDIYETGSTIEKSEAEIKVARERQTGLENQRVNLENEIAELKIKAAQEKEQHAGDVRSLQQLREKITAQEQELAAAENRLAALEAGLQENQKDIEEKKSVIIDLLNEMAAVNNSINAGEIEKQNLERRISQLEQQHLTLSQEFQSCLEKEDALRQQIGEAAARKDSLTAKEQSLSKDRLNMEKNLEQLEAEYSRAIKQLQEKSSRLKALEELQHHYEGYYRGVKEVLVAAKNDRCRGIHGVVAEIIKVPARFETAVEVALGSALQHIITENEDDAAKAIEYLKQNRAGRATFLPLTTVKGAPKDKKHGDYSSTKGFCGVARDLIQFDEKYSKIMDYLLGRVMVVDNIRNATELARSTGFNVKIVTLDGDVINPGGAMTGGSQQKGGASLLSRVREIEEISHLRADLTKTVQALEKETAEIRLRYEECIRNIHETQNGLRELLMERNSLDKDLAMVLQEKERIDSTRSLFEEEKQNLFTEIGKVQQKAAGYRKQLQELQARDEGIREELARQHDSLSGQEEERTRLAEAVTGIKVSLAGLNREEVNYRQIMSRVDDAIRDIEGQISRKAGQAAEFEAQKGNLTLTIEEHLAAITELSGQKGAKEEQLNGLRNEKQSLVGGISEREAGSKLLGRELAQARELIHSSDVKKARLEYDTENSLVKLTEEFQLTWAEAMLKKTELKNRKETTVRIKELKEAISLLGNVNVGAIEEFDRVKERYEFLNRQYHDLEQAKESLFKVIDEMDQIMTKRFSEAFKEININFGEVFTQLFGGGRAELMMTDADNLLECGIDIMAQPPGKKPQHLSLLSGGEKALTAISLLFAILKTKPSPFCILDEIEASLDEVNADRFAVYLKDFSLNTQFIVITHRKRTMEAADILYGVTMDDTSVTKLVSMKLTDARADKVS